jgi:hypothetical protein
MRKSLCVILLSVGCMAQSVYPNMTGHPATAVAVIVPSGGGTSTATGDRPASDFPTPEQVSLGEIARELRVKKEADTTAKKATVIYVNY